MLILGLAWWIAACSDGVEITPSGKLIKETRIVPSFSSVVLANGISLVLSQGDKDEIVVEADDNIIRYVETYVQGETLSVKIQDGIDIDSDDRRKTVKIVASASLLESLHVSGGGSVTLLPPFYMDRFELVSSGGSTVAGEVNVGVLTSDVSGGGQVYLEGYCTCQNLNVSGGSQYRLFGLESENVEIVISGGSTAELYVNDTLFVKSASGGSRIYCKGDAQVTEQNISGGSVVVRL